MLTGETVTDAVFSPVDHRYVLPPEAVSWVPVPAQIVRLPLTVAVTAGFTDTVTLVTDRQPVALVTVTEYAVVLTGAATNEALVLPVDHR